MNTRWELDEGITTIKSAWQREHTARANLEKMLKQTKVENAKLRELVAAMPYCMEARCLECPMCSTFDVSIGGTPECRASWKLCELGVLT